MPRRGLEPPRPCDRQHLKLVRLPIPPSGHGVGGAPLGERSRRLSTGVARGKGRRDDADGSRPQAMKDKLVTSVGGGGFVGRYVAQALLRGGARVRVAAARSAPGVVPEAAGRARPDPVRRRRRDAARHGRARGRRAPTRWSTWSACSAGDFDARPCRRRARRSPRRRRAAGVGALVHISAIGADAERAVAPMAARKGEGEAAVRAAFPTRDDPAALDRVRARGPVHQPLRRR